MGRNDKVRHLECLFLICILRIIEKSLFKTINISLPPYTYSKRNERRDTFTSFYQIMLICKIKSSKKVDEILIEIFQPTIIRRTLNFINAHIGSQMPVFNINGHLQFSKLKIKYW